MPPIIPDTIPSHFPAGTTVKYTRSFSDFQPSDGWSYTLYLNGLTQKLNKAAIVDGNTFLLVLLPADTATLNSGPFRYAERLSKAAMTFALTSVQAPDSNGNARYNFSSSSGPTPQNGALVTITGFTNGANNITGVIANLAANSFTLKNASAIPGIDGGDRDDPGGELRQRR